MKRGISLWAHRLTHRALILSVATVGTAVFLGCDDYGEKKALDAQAETNAMRVSGRGTADESIQKLSSVASGTGETPVLIQTQQSLGEVQLAKADAGANELARLALEASQTVFRIGELARQARTSVVLADSYHQLDPKASVELIGTMTAQVRGDGNQAAYPIDVAKIPTLAIAQQEKTRLDGEVTKTRDAITAATKDRDSALAEAGKASALVETLNGDARAAMVKQIADLHARAAAASRTVSDQNSALARLQADQAAQAAMITQLQTAVETMTSQGTSLSQGWTVTAAKAGDQTALAKKILEGDGDSVKTLTAKLNTQLKEVDSRRGDVEQLYKDAIASFVKAADKAGRRIIDLNKAKSDSKGGAYEVGAWEHEMSLLAVDRINLEKSAAEKGLADFYAARAFWLANTLGTSQAVEDVSNQLNIAAADPFNTDKLKTDLGKEIAEAAEAYDTVGATLGGVNLLTEDLAPLKPAKAMRKIVTLSDEANLADLAAANKVAPDLAKKAGDFHKDMLAAVAEAKESNVALPMLPVSLGGTPPAAPADAATEATTQSNDDPATAAVREAMTKMLQLLEAGNLDELKSASIVEEGGDAEIQDLANVLAKIKHFKAAGSQKFADNPLYQAIQSQDILSSTSTPKNTKFKIVDDKAYTDPHTDGEAEDFRLVDGMWKAVFAGPKTDVEKAERAKVLDVADALDKAATEIEAGTLTDLTDLAKVLAASAADSTTAPTTEATQPAGDTSVPATTPPAAQ